MGVERGKMLNGAKVSAEEWVRSLNVAADDLVTASTLAVSTEIVRLPPTEGFLEPMELVSVVICLIVQSDDRRVGVRGALSLDQFLDLADKMRTRYGKPH